jgi:hypothetical protein
VIGCSYRLATPPAQFTRRGGRTFSEWFGDDGSCVLAVHRRLHPRGIVGYGAFSVSPRELDALLQYIDAQREHHRTSSFQEDYRELLRRHGVDFDERHVWG